MSPGCPSPAPYRPRCEQPLHSPLWHRHTAPGPLLSEGRVPGHITRAAAKEEAQPHSSGGSLLRSHSLSQNPQALVLAARGRCCSILCSASVLSIPSGVVTYPCCSHPAELGAALPPPPAPAWGAPVPLCSRLAGREPSATREERTPCREAWRYGQIFGCTVTAGRGCAFLGYSSCY